MSNSPIRLPTPGYDPHNVLWHLFHQTQDRHNNQKGIRGCRMLTEAERKQIDHIVGYVTEHRMHPEGSTLVERFKLIMQDKNGTRLAAEDESLAQGLLECLDSFQPYSPWMDPEAVAFKLGAIWDHFKGGIYLKTGISSWSSGHGEPVVEYTSLLFGTKHTKLVSDWCEVVRWPDGKYRARYVHRVGDDVTKPPSYKVPSPQV